jgi:hypothetical protein
MPISSAVGALYVLGSLFAASSIRSWRVTGGSQLADIIWAELENVRRVVAAYAITSGWMLVTLMIPFPFSWTPSGQQSTYIHMISNIPVTVAIELSVKAPVMLSEQYPHRINNLGLKRNMQKSCSTLRLAITSYASGRAVISMTGFRDSCRTQPVVSMRRNGTRQCEEGHQPHDGGRCWSIC